MAFTEFILKIDKGLGVKSHEDVGAFHANLMGKVSDYHHAERLFEKYCAAALESLEQMKKEKEGEVRGLQEQITLKQGEVERLMAAFDLDKLEIKTQESNPDIMILK